MATSGHPTSRSGESATERYEVISRPTEGTLWRCYKARDLRTNRIVALRALKPSLSRHPRLPQTLTPALEAVSTLRHRHLVSVLDCGIEEGTPFVVTEWLGAGSLEKVLQRGPLPEKETRLLIEQVTEGLSELHRSGVVHGDLRPRNCLLGNDGVIRLGDYGLHEALARCRFSPTEVFEDAIYYQAPELLEGQPPSEAGDLYALGVIVYWALAGHLPFEGPSPVQIARLHRTQPPVPPSSANRRCNPVLEAIVLRLLAKDPAQRYPSAEALLADLREGSVPAPPARTTPKVWRETESPAEPAIPPAPAPSPRGERDIPLRRVEATAPEVRPTPVPRTRREARSALLGCLWSLLTLGVLAGIVYGGYALYIQGVPETVTVPKYVGLQEDQAQTALQGAGLKMRTGQEKYDPRRPAGTVLAGDIPEGREVRKGREVTVTISRGEEPIRMLDYSELSLQRARQIMNRYGLRLGQVTSQYHDTVPSGYVCGQFPEAGQTFRRSETISLVISKGPQPRNGEDTDLGTTEPAPPVSNPENPGWEAAPTAEPREVMVERTVKIRVAIPVNGQESNVRIVVRDSEGEHTVYNEMHQPGDLVDQTVLVTRPQGSTALIRVYVNDELYKEVHA